MLNQNSVNSFNVAPSTLGLSGFPARTLNYSRIPSELRAQNTWVLWKSNKVPFQCNGRPASSTDQTTWNSFESVLAEYEANPSFSGVGCVISEPYTGVDFDHCRDPKTGEVTKFATDAIAALASYTELSPSGTGYHVWVRGNLPHAIKTSEIEIYPRARYFTMSGLHVTGTSQTINECDLIAFSNKFLPDAVKEKREPSPAKDNFDRLSDAVADKNDGNRWAPVEKRLGFVLADPGRNQDCPFHDTHSTPMNFGVMLKDERSIVCNGATGEGRHSWDLVQAIHDWDNQGDVIEGNTPRYRNMFEAARALCVEEGLNFDEFFPQPRGPYLGSCGAAGTPGAPGSSDVIDVADVVKKLLFLTRKQRLAMSLPGNREEALNLVDRLVYDDLKANGRFYNVGGLGYFIQSGQESKPIKISPTSPEFQNVLEKYGLHAGRAAKDTVGKFIGVRSFMDGEHVSQHISFHYNPETQTAYYAEALGTLLKVTRDGFTRIKNGEEGVLFIYPDNYKPWTFTPVTGIKNSLIPAEGSAICDIMLKPLLFEDSAMTNQQRHILLMVYLILLFLPGLNKSKSILQMLGPSGSGKSFFLETIGRLVLGPEFGPRPIPNDPKEFENQVINSSFIAYDNVNKVSNEIKDLFCQVATGLTVNRRELFTTAGQVSFPALATVAISGITSVLSQVEHTNRSLIIHMKERPEGTFKSYKGLMKNLDNHRNQLMSELVERVRLVLVAQDVQRDYDPQTNVRLADVAVFLLRVARHEGWEQTALETLNAWVDEQQDSALEDDDIGEVLIQVLRNEHFESKWMTAGEFHNLLSTTGHHHRISMGVWSDKGPKTLSTQLLHNLKSYASRFGLQKTLNKHTKNNMFRLNPSAELLAGIRSSDIGGAI